MHEDAQCAIAFIEKSAAAKKPFFINLWMHEPHTPFHTVPKYEWRFRDLESREDQIYASVLSHADDRIGELLAALDRLQLTENTLVIFSSDNGPAHDKKGATLQLGYDTATGAGWYGASKGVTAGRKGYKAALFEGGVNVPFIARWPGKIAAGKIDNTSLISAVDLLPTFCELAGAKLPEGYQPDGLSQVVVLQGTALLGSALQATAAPIRAKPLFWRTSATWPPKPEEPSHWATYAVVDEHWKLLSNRDGSHVELYDLAADALETIDLAADRSEVVKQLTAKLEAWKATLPEKPTGAVFSAERRR